MRHHQCYRKRNVNDPIGERVQSLGDSYHSAVECPSFSHSIDRWSNSNSSPYLVHRLICLTLLLCIADVGHCAVYSPTKTREFRDNAATLPMASRSAEVQRSRPAPRPDSSERPYSGHVVFSSGFRRIPASVRVGYSLAALGSNEPDFWRN